MPKFDKKIAMWLTPEICEWLDQKASIGYRRTSVVALVLMDRMRREKAKAIPADGGAK